MFDFVSFVIGVLLGAIITLLLVWIAYFTRSFLFTYCPTQARPCGAADYFNDPGDALANDPNLTAADILFLNSDNQLFYKRVPRNTTCVPEDNQIVHIQFPQYCSFSGTGIQGTWRETGFNSNFYIPFGFSGPDVTTDGNCIPEAGQPVTEGVPELKWDANPIS